MCELFRQLAYFFPFKKHESAVPCVRSRFHFLRPKVAFTGQGTGVIDDHWLIVLIEAPKALIGDKQIQNRIVAEIFQFHIRPVANFRGEAQNLVKLTASALLKCLVVLEGTDSGLPLDAEPEEFFS